MKRKKASFQSVRPLQLIQPLLTRAVVQAAGKRPEIFERLGEHGRKRFLIIPVNTPFMFLLQPDASNPRLSMFRRNTIPAHDAAISGKLTTLLDMILGKQDGDALFFSRDLSVKGDVEAVVVLRNAIDDTDGSMIDDLLPLFARPFSRLFRKAREAQASWQ